MSNMPMLLVFAEGDTLCALDASEVREVVFLPELIRPPGTPGVLEGFMTLDGEAVPVVRAARLLGLEAGADGVYTPAMILKNGKAALAAERMADMFRPAPGDLSPAPDGHSLNDCLAGIVRRRGADISLLSAEKLLLKEESQRVDALKAALKARLDAMASQAT